YLCHSQHPIFLPKGEMKLKRNISSLMVKSFVQRLYLATEMAVSEILMGSALVIFMIIKG
ncbi:MAG: hypothetical protein ACRC0J_03270, partial [Shewanella oncorhynchi]